MSGFYPKNPGLGQVVQSDVAAEHPDRSFIAHIEWTALEALAASTTGVHAAVTCNGSTQVITTAITNPEVPRSITATAGGTGTDIGAIQVTIAGTNINDEVISEVLPVFTVDTPGSVEGNKAFKTVTSISIPAHDGLAATTAIGWGDKLGLPYAEEEIPCIDSFLNSVHEGTAAAITASATAIESNTIDLNSALNATKVDAYLVI